MPRNIWRVESSGQQYIVEMRLDGKGWFSTGGGSLHLNGNMLKTWGSSFTEAVPKMLEFEIAGKPAVIRRRGVLNQVPVLYYDGKEIKET